MGLKMWEVKFGTYNSGRIVIAKTIEEAIKKASKFKPDFKEENIAITAVELIAEED